MSTFNLTPEYIGLLTKFPPRVIQTEEQCEAYNDALDWLEQQEGDWTPESEEFADLLALLIEDFDDRRAGLISLSLPDPMQRFVEAQVISGAYPNADEYIRDLVRADQKRHAKQELEQVLLSALSSEDAADMTPEMIEQVRNKLRTSGER